MYDVLLFLHIAAAIVWLGSGFLFQVLGLRAIRAGEPIHMSGVLDDLNALSTRLFIPASLAVFLLGVALTIDGPWSFGDTWILIGLAGYAATFLTGLLLIKPQGEKIAALMEREGGVTPPVFDEIKKLLVTSRIDLVVLFAVVADMTFKPA